MTICSETVEWPGKITLALSFISYLIMFGPMTLCMIEPMMVKHSEPSTFWTKTRVNAWPIRVDRKFYSENVIDVLTDLQISNVVETDD